MLGRFFKFYGTGLVFNCLLSTSNIIFLQLCTSGAYLGRHCTMPLTFFTLPFSKSRSNVVEVTKYSYIRLLQ